MSAPAIQIWMQADVYDEAPAREILVKAEADIRRVVPEANVRVIKCEPHWHEPHRYDLGIEVDVPEIDATEAATRIKALRQGEWLGETVFDELTSEEWWERDRGHANAVLFAPEVTAVALRVHREAGTHAA